MTTTEHMARLSRRRMLRGAAGSVAAALLAACGGEVPTAVPSAPPAAPTATAANLTPVRPAVPTATVPPPATSTTAATLAVATATVRPTVAMAATVGGPVNMTAGTVGGTAPPGSVAGTLAASTQARTTSPAGTALPFPTGFAGSTSAAMLPGITPPADLVGRLSVQRLTLALPPGGNDAAGTLAVYADLLAYMTKALGVEVVGVVGPSAADTVDAMRARTVDATILSPFAYLLAKQQAFAVPLVQGEAGDGMPAQSSVVLIGRRDGRLNTPIDVRAKTVAFVTEDPSIGQVLPAYLLATNPRLIEDRDYTVLRVLTWADAYSAVTTGHADAAVLTTAFFQRGLEAHTIDNNRVKVLDKSPEIAGSLVAARGDLPMGDADTLTALFLTINDQPAMSRFAQGIIASPPNGAGTFGETAVKLRKASDATYGGARDIVARFGVDLRALAH